MTKIVMIFLLNLEINVSNRYLGCYGDSAPPNRAMTYHYGESSRNTIEYCSAKCASNGSTYLGLQVKLRVTIFW